MKRKANGTFHRAAITGRTAWKTWVIAYVVCGALVLSGCGRNRGGTAQDVDPQVSATLQRLTQELHHAMAGRKINRDFDEFVAMNPVEVPPPPVGKKYAIDERWKVVLVNQ